MSASLPPSSLGTCKSPPRTPLEAHHRLTHHATDRALRASEPKKLRAQFRDDRVAACVYDTGRRTPLVISSRSKTWRVGGAAAAGHGRRVKDMSLLADVKRVRTATRSGGPEGPTGLLIASMQPSTEQLG